MTEDIEISISTSSGSRDCFSCGSKIKDRTITVSGFSQEITFHEICFDNFVMLLDTWKE